MKLCNKCLLINEFFSIKGSPSLGEKFDPAQDCTEIVDNVPDAQDGIYWIKTANGGAVKVSRKNTRFNKEFSLYYIFKVYSCF